MNFLKSLGPSELVLLVLVVCVVIFLAVWGFYKKLKELKECFRVMGGEDPSLPESFSVMTTDGAHLVLERKRIDNKWCYVLKDLPYRFAPPERSPLEIPECLKGTPEEDTLRRFDELTKPGGMMDEVIRAAYNTPEEIERQKLRERIGEIVREKPVTT